FDESPPDITIPHETLDGGHTQLVGHRVCSGLARIGHRHDNRVGIDRDPAQLLFFTSQFPAQRRPRQVDAALIERAGHIGEVDPFKKAVGGLFLWSETLKTNLVILNDNHFARLERANVAETEVEQRHALTGGGEERAVLGITKRPKSLWVAHNG